jgi:hypothetical protein
MPLNNEYEIMWIEAAVAYKAPFGISVEGQVKSLDKIWESQGQE